MIALPAGARLVGYLTGFCTLSKNPLMTFIAWSISNSVIVLLIQVSRLFSKNFSTFTARLVGHTARKRVDTATMLPTWNALRSWSARTCSSRAVILWSAVAMRQRYASVLAVGK